MLQFAAVTLEHIWMHRNKVNHGDSLPDIAVLGQTITRLTQHYHKAATQRRTVLGHACDPPAWAPPPPGFLKVNFDAAFDGDTAITGFLVSNSLGCFTYAWTGCSYASTAYVAEAEAAYQALKWAHQQQIQSIMFEGDDILALNGSNQFVEWQRKHSILSGRKFLCDNSLWSVSHIPRSCNYFAHNLAQWAKLTHSFGYVSPPSLPPSVLCNRGGTVYVCASPEDLLNEID